jgi:hypothetical protein
VAEAIAQVGFTKFLAAICLAGILQIAFGALRLGLIAYYFPSAVITGMLAGIGIIIALKQIPHLVGYDVDWEGDLSYVEPGGETTLAALFHMLGALSWGAIWIGAVGPGCSSCGKGRSSSAWRFLRGYPARWQRWSPGLSSIKFSHPIYQNLPFPQSI